ncbi:hypothetical protein [uncultured Roseobacter sp.]|uniref:alginate O-acetyltransferase AlgX-related protein n=1 Tax=uncultured Roseobacter sp. TaxID=114847 RepID=UPI002602C4A7|nr:hypothetical protein [uncultured Roseobacter sp.]
MISRFSIQHLAPHGFVLSLATVGLFSHQNADLDALPSDIIKGSLQTQYEDAFVAANPLERFAVTALGALRYGLFGQASQGALAGRNGWLFTAEELEQNTNFSANIDAAATRVAEVSAEMATRGIYLLPVILPDKAEVYAEQLDRARPADVTERRGHFLAALSDQRIATLDATTALQTASQNGDAFMRTDTHWSPHGSRAVAEAIADQVTERGISLSTAAVSTESTDRAYFEGDLLRFVPTGALRSWIGPATEHIDRFTTTVETQGGLFDSPSIDVVLVGTSFSARPDWHFADFLKQALQADVLSFAEEGRGPFAPMQEFLASDFYQNSPPKLVIWEIPVRYTSKEMIQ